MTTNISVKQLATLAMESDSIDPIDWGELNINEEQAFLLMANHVLEIYQRTPEPEIMMATVTKLLVENFTLNLKLHGKR
jgi:hypothetical protein|tara:strand:- start:421 stop:657 length:237 start_codon:yes stop_codon:yes gene_type:complete